MQCLLQITIVTEHISGNGAVQLVFTTFLVFFSGTVDKYHINLLSISEIRDQRPKTNYRQEYTGNSDYYLNQQRAIRRDW